MTKKVIGLFSTCLVESMRPSVSQATAKLLLYLGFEVVLPKSQTCCGQPAWNAGYQKQSLALARKCVSEFMHCDYVIIPSGSCAGMMRKHYQELDSSNTELIKHAEKCFEICEFLIDICSIQLPLSATPLTLTYHDSCAGLREMNIKEQPRLLLEQCGHTIIEMTDCEQCCGFGGLFSTKFGEISSSIASEKCQKILENGSPIIAMGDVGCMLNIEGKLMYEGHNNVKVMHVTEILAQSI